MKNSLIAILLSLATLQAQAGDVYAQCVTEFPTTSYFLDSSTDKAELEVIHHNGLQYAPFWDSIVVPNDFNTLKEKADMIMKLDSTIKASWKKSDCRISGPHQFVCMGKTDTVKVNGVEIEPWAVYSSLHKQNSFAGEYEHVEVAFRFYVNDVAHQFVMKYQTGECNVSDSKILKNK